MDSFDITADFFHQQIAQISLSADSVAGLAETAAPVIAGAMMAEHRVYSIGTGIDAHLAHTFCHVIREGMGAERPNLPISPLTSEAAEPIDAAANWIAREIRTLGHPGDVAIVWGSNLTASGVDLLHSVLTQREITSFWIGTNSPSQSLPFADANASVRLGLCAMTGVAIARIVESVLFDH